MVTQDINIGYLHKIGNSKLYEKTKKSNIIFPNEYYLTDILLKTETMPLISFEIIGKVPHKYQNQYVKIINSYDRLYDKIIEMNQIYVGQKEIINEVLIKKP
jgi:hypothetical protein